MRFYTKPSSRAQFLRSTGNESSRRKSAWRAVIETLKKWKFSLLTPNLKSFRVPAGEDAGRVQELEEQASTGGRRADPATVEGKTFKRQSHHARVSSP